MLAGTILGKNVKCHYCGGALSVVQRMRHSRFCSDAHHQLYLAKQEEVAFEALTTRRISTSEAGGAGIGGERPEGDGQAIALGNLQAAVASSSPSSSVSGAPNPPSGGPEGLCRFQQHVLDHLPGGVAVFASADSLVYSNETYRAIWPESGGKEPAKVGRAIAKAFRDGVEEREVRIVLRPGKGGTVRLKLMRIPAVDSETSQLTKGLKSKRSRGLDCVAGLRMLKERPHHFGPSLQRPQ